MCVDPNIEYLLSLGTAKVVDFLRTCVPIFNVPGNDKNQWLNNFSYYLSVNTISAILQTQSPDPQITNYVQNMINVRQIY
jgi:hypothetical protein